MRWPRDLPPMPQAGDRRARRVFAWRKTAIDDEWVWLEPYEIHEKFLQPCITKSGWWIEVGRNTLDFYY